ncbi:MAG: 3-isopropylmalate dehydrogenase [Actinobacteria bacterium]|nr:3-isopropylmalate dehydrogenase [Actinomycetota bacterium]
MTVACLPGDGIGPEVLAQAVRVLDHFGIAHEEHPFGGAAIKALSTPLPPQTLQACRTADAVLLGAVGLPELEGLPVRPEQGLIGLRKELDVYANLRPARQGNVDLIIVRELVGGLYYGERGTRADGTVFDTCEYTPEQVERIARRAFEIARTRRGRLTSVDKVNVLATSRLWRDIVIAVSADYTDVPLDHALVDSFAMTIVRSPETIDVVVTENTFGDILSDVAAAVTGGLGLAASASLGDGGPGIFEPVHGSAPAIAGQGIANPAAMLRSVALMLAHGLGRPTEAAALEAAVGAALASAPTPDLGGAASTAQFGDAVLRELGTSPTV